MTKTLSLSEREKQQIKAMLDAGQPLPPRYRAVLFADPREAELIWPGKTSEVTDVVLPFQTIEQVDEPARGGQRPPRRRPVRLRRRRPAGSPAAGPTS